MVLLDGRVYSVENILYDSRAGENRRSVINLTSTSPHSFAPSIEILQSNGIIEHFFISGRITPLAREMQIITMKGSGGAGILLPCCSGIPFRLLLAVSISGPRDSPGLTANRTKNREAAILEGFVICTTGAQEGTSC
jgi:hypothetical protein